MSLEVWAIILLSVILLAWYGVGYWVNMRRGRALFMRVDEGVDVLGGEVESGWIGSPASGARINIRHAGSPFRRAEITLLMQNREVPFLWLYDSLRGKRDQVIIKVTLRKAPKGEVLVTRNKSKYASHGAEGTWKWQENPGGLAVARRGKGARQQMKALEPVLETYGADIKQLSWNEDDPHLMIDMHSTGVEVRSPEAFFTDLKAALNETIL